MKKIIIGILLAMIPIMGVAKFGNTQEKGIYEEPFALAITFCGANLLESQVICWAKISVESSPQEYLQTLLQEHAIYAADQEIQIKNDSYKNMVAYNYSPLNITFSVIDILPKNLSYLIMETQLHVSSYDQQLEFINKFLDDNFTVYYQFSGEIEKPLTREERLQLLNSLARDLGCPYQSVFNDGQVTSIAAYSPKVAPYIKAVACMHKKYNLQAAIRCNPQEGKTHIYLGFPLLLNNY